MSACSDVRLYAHSAMHELWARVGRCGLVSEEPLVALKLVRESTLASERNYPSPRWRELLRVSRLCLPQIGSTHDTLHGTLRENNVTPIFKFCLYGRILMILQICPFNSSTIRPR